VTTRRGRPYVVGSVDEISGGGRRIVHVAGRSIGLFESNGRLFAIRNRCPHQGGPLCAGPLTGLVTSSSPGAVNFERDGEILRCPWHGWEFDLTNGRSIVDPDAVRVRSYDVVVGVPKLETYSLEVRDDQIVIFV
jgi:nitrite reductase (NADH) small subunit